MRISVAKETAPLEEREAARLRGGRPGADVEVGRACFKLQPCSITLLAMHGQSGFLAVVHSILPEGKTDWSHNQLLSPRSNGDNMLKLHV